MPKKKVYSNQYDKSSKESDSEVEKQIDYAQESISLNETTVILLEPIIQNEVYLEKDIVALLGNLIVEQTEYTLFEFNQNIPKDGDCIINQSFQTSLRDELGKRIIQGNFGIFLKFNCSTKNKRKFNHYIKIGNKIIKLIKEFIHMQQSQQSSSSMLIDIFIQKLKLYQKSRNN